MTNSEGHALQIRRKHCKVKKQRQDPEKWEKKRKKQNKYM
jgi:hypothetical protein